MTDSRVANAFIALFMAENTLNRVKKSLILKGISKEEVNILNASLRLINTAFNKFSLTEEEFNEVTSILDKVLTRYLIGQTDHAKEEFLARLLAQSPPVTSKPQ